VEAMSNQIWWDIDFSDDSMRSSLQNNQIIFSYFDHWLTEEQAFNHQFMTYCLALKRRLLDHYRVAEDRFLLFLNKLAAMSAVLDPEGGQVIVEGDLQNVFRDVIREQRRTAVVFEDIQLILSPARDLTHVLYLFEGGVGRDVLADYIAESGLFILE